MFRLGRSMFHQSKLISLVDGPPTSGKPIPNPGADRGTGTRQAVTVGATGTLVGLAIAWQAAPLLQPQLFQVRLLHPIVVGAVTLGLLAVSVLAVTTGTARSDP
jgi:hypothetical protein